jgi:hypothetical protein
MIHIITNIILGACGLIAVVDWVQRQYKKFKLRRNNASNVVDSKYGQE